MGTVTLGAECQSARMSKITNDWLNRLWHRMFYSSTHMATVGAKGLVVSNDTVVTGYCQW